MKKYENQELKKILLGNAEKIRLIKNKIKEKQNMLNWPGVPSEVLQQTKQQIKGFVKNLQFTQLAYREDHIAYSEMRGRSREQIEKPKTAQEITEEIIDAIKKQFPNKAIV